MEKITKLVVSVKGLLPTLVGLVQEWNPPPLKTEIQYRDNLIEFLRRSLPDDARVEPEYRHRGTTMDIYLSWRGMVFNDEVSFELKKDLKRKTDFDRLIGQLEGLDVRKNKVCLVLIGDTDNALLGRIKEKYASALCDASDEPGALAIVLVRPEEQKTKEKAKKAKGSDWW